MIPMYLAVNSAGSHLQIALVSTEYDLIYGEERECSGRAMGIIGTMARDIFSVTGVRPKNLQGLAPVLGPGTFTGLRIAMAFALGLKFAHDLPMGGISNLELLAAEYVYRLPSAEEPKPFCVAIYARKNFAFIQHVDEKGVPTGPVELRKTDKISEHHKRCLEKNYVAILVSNDKHMDKSWEKWHCRPGNRPSLLTLSKTIKKCTFAAQVPNIQYHRLADAEEKAKSA